MPPLATFRTQAVGFIFFSSEIPIMPLVEAIIGVWIGSYATRSMPRPPAARATVRPTKMFSLRTMVKIASHAHLYQGQ
ncbi:hypothetical protein KC337_g100 [Hortaea werneckii]|nr:hypothetical protein KC337_g100 [Hortaea werneckii]